MRGYMKVHKIYFFWEGRGGEGGMIMHILKVHQNLKGVYARNTKVLGEGEGEGGVLAPQTYT